jgi:ABC-type sugar transport system ATPase subunit
VQASHPEVGTEAEVLSSTPALELTGAWKAFGHVVALRDVSLNAYPGEVLAVVGDNGAGKSTMVKVISGVYALDQGELRIRGKTLKGSDPHVARSMGVSTVFQDLALVETLDVAANMFLGQPLSRWRFFADRPRMIDEAAKTIRALRVRLPSVRVPVGELSGGQRQGVAIARAIRDDNPIVVMDEPTAALGVRETQQVADTVAELRANGKAVILISHDVSFVFKVADRVQVMRLGRVQGIRQVAETTPEELVGLITGALPGDHEVGKRDSDA